MQVLKSISKSENVIPTTIEYVDIAGLVKGASTGEGLGNKFLANIRECDSIVQVRPSLSGRTVGKSARLHGSQEMGLRTALPFARLAQFGRAYDS